VEPKKNVIHFLADQALNGLYSGRVERYLQTSGEVGYSCFADSVEAFEEMTKNPNFQWHLLIVDVARANSAAAAIGRFRDTHAECVVAVLQTRNGASAQLENAIVLNHPYDDDDWLSMMHSLLSRV